MTKQDETFKKLLKERLTGMLQKEFNDKVDSLVTSILDTESSQDKPYCLEFNHEFSPEMIHLIRSLVG